MGFLKHVWAWRTILILFLTPIVFLPFPLIVKSSEAKCAYVVILMAVYWITESLPVAVTALIPVFLFPVLEIVSSSAVAAQYMNDVNMLFLGGLVMAIAIEYWNLHRRVALLVLMAVGSEPRLLMLGMMLATWFLSMWVSNTACTAMMIPIAEAILVQLRVTSETEHTPAGKDLELTVAPSHEQERNHDVSVDISVKVQKNGDQDGTKQKGEKEPSLSNDDNGDAFTEKEDAEFKRLGKAMSLSICYAANSGGIACLTGTGPNLALKAQADKIYADYKIHNPVTFGSWMAYGLPLSIIILLVCWVWLQIAFLRCKGLGECFSGKTQDSAHSTRIKQMIREEYRKLGPLVFGQVLVMIFFVVMVVLWITRDLGGVAGWGTLVDPPVKDGAVAILIALLMFALPSTLPCLASYQNPAHPLKWNAENGGQGGPLQIQPLLHWKVVHERMPWHLFLLLGGGYALSKGCEDSGLSRWIGKQLEFFSSWNRWGILFIICYITAAATEVMSNTAIATLLMPIMSTLAINTRVHPLYYMLPTAMACSFAFMLPVATPPNAIVFAYGRIKIVDMAIAGFVLNLFAVPILVGVTGTIGNAIFDFDNVPMEFLNATLQANLTLSAA